MGGLECECLGINSRRQTPLTAQAAIREQRQ